MRIELSDFPRLTIDQGERGQTKSPRESFVDALKQAVETTNKQAKDAEQSMLDLARGESGNIHETMIAMQKADINLRLLVTTANKLIEGYNQLTQLR